MTRLKSVDLQYVWHPFTQMRDFDPHENLIMVRGDGNYLEDDRGMRYLDATSSLWVNAHGHNHPVLNSAIRHQVGKLSHSTLLGIGNEASALLAQRLVEISPPSLTRVFYSDNGSTAAEVALKMAFQYHRHKGATGSQRSRFVSLREGYHGDTLGSVSVGGMDLFHAIFKPLLFHTYLAPSPNCYRCPFDASYPGCQMPCVGALEKLLAERGDEIAAVILEPLVQGAGGMVIYPPAVLRGYYEATRRHGVLFIVDEVATGFGRTGTLFACEQAGVEPDMMALAKALTGGYLPVAATLVAEEIYQTFMADWAEFKTFFHGHTFTGNPLGCAAALANLDLVTAPTFLPRVNAVARHLAERLDRLRDHPNVGSIRQLGLMGGIELVAEKSSRKPLDWQLRTGHHVCLAAREAGVLARPLGDVLVLMPPLSSTDGEVDLLVDALEYGIDRVVRGGTAPVPHLMGAAHTGFSVLAEPPAAQRTSNNARLFVTGTDTGVGKTVVTMALAAACRRFGGAPVAYKPVESGVEGVAPAQTDRGRLASVADALVGAPEIALPLPLSPNVAARLAGVEVPFEELVVAVSQAAPAGPLMVEGAGGLMVPCTDGWSFADLARRAGLGALVVVGDKLGCLNHTLLTVSMANSLGIAVAGVVLHRLEPEVTQVAQDHNGAELARLLGALYLGTVPYVEDLSDMSALADAGAEVAQRLWPELTE
jgi:adenosylmethionine-8-amino-7-oxononanoate aminotransferase